MSRINEALRRRALAEPHRSEVAPLEYSETDAEESVLDRFAAETNSAVSLGTLPDASSPRSNTLPAAFEETLESAFGHRLDPLPEVATERRPVVASRAASRQLRFDPEWSAKLIVARDASPTGVLQYRRLAGALAQWKREKGDNAVLVTSAREGDGKTLTAVNLALTFSQSFGRRVLLIDANLRRPSLHTIFTLPNTRGLSDALRSGHDDLPIAQVSETLSVLSAGATGAKSTAALTSHRMEQLLKQLCASVDWVLLDADPVESMPDADRLARIVGAVLFVIRAGSTPDRVVNRAVAQLPLECVIGTVLNGVGATNDVACVAR